jgi:beta-mannosidase
MGVKEFMLYNGIAQGLEYQDLALALRRRTHCSGDLIWMYNDCWPETGWTIIDYFLTRKVSFYFLKRAFAFRQFIIRVFDGKGFITMRNDSPEAVKLNYEVGYTGFDGKDAWAKPASIELAPFSLVELPAFAADIDAKKGVYFIRAVGDGHGFAPASSSRAYYRDYDIVDGTAEVLSAKRDGDDVVLTIKAGDMFLPFVQVECADDRTHLDDNFFEMLPNAVKTVRVYHCKEIPAVRVLKVSKGNHDFVLEMPGWPKKNQPTLG